MKRAKSLVLGAGLAALIIALLPIYVGQLLVSRFVTRRRRPEPVTVPRVDIASTSLQDIIDTRRPTIISGLIDALDLDVVPDVDGLRALGADFGEPFRVKSHSSDAPYFLYRGDYGATVDASRDMSSDDFFDFMFNDAQPEGLCTYRLFNVRDLGGRIGGVIDDIATRLADHTAIRPDREASGIWIGSAGVVTPLHHDAWTGLLFQLHGAKRVAMFSPSDRGNLYFSSPLAPNDVWSTLPPRSASADPAEFPRYQQATRHEARLEAGDVLFIPPFWSHEIEALEANISIPFRFAAGVREHLDPGFVIPAYEVFHRKFLADRAAS